MKKLILGVGLLSLIGCTSTAKQNQNNDYGSAVETPDVLLQDASATKTTFGDKDFDLAADAKSHDQQEKPDLLIQDFNRQTPPAAPQTTVVTEQTATTTAVELAKPTKPHTPEPVIDTQQDTRAMPATTAKPTVVSTPKTTTPVPKPTAVSTQSTKPTQPQKPTLTEEQRLQRDSALRVEDPLLGEVEPR